MFKELPKHFCPLDKLGESEFLNFNMVLRRHQSNQYYTDLGRVVFHSI